MASFDREIIEELKSAYLKWRKLNREGKTYTSFSYLVDKARLEGDLLPPDPAPLNSSNHSTEQL